MSGKCTENRFRWVQGFFKISIIINVNFTDNYIKDRDFKDNTVSH